jgi:hypothetical protein
VSPGFVIKIPATPITYAVQIDIGRYGIALQVNDDPYGPFLVTYWHWGSGKRFWLWRRMDGPCLGRMRDGSRA